MLLIETLLQAKSRLKHYTIYCTLTNVFFCHVYVKITKANSKQEIPIENYLTKNCTSFNQSEDDWLQIYFMNSDFLFEFCFIKITKKTPCNYDLRQVEDLKSSKLPKTYHKGGLITESFSLCLKWPKICKICLAG